MSSILAALLRIMLLGAGLLSATAWRGVDSVLAFPETAVVMLVTGASVLTSGAAFGFSLLVRSLAALGLVDALLRSATTYMPGFHGGLAVRMVTTVLVVATAFAIARWLYWNRNVCPWDAPLFFALGSLFIAMGTRDAMGADVWPYRIGNVGIWTLLALAAATTFRLAVRRKATMAAAELRRAQ
jgi:hypothetical protein